MKICNNCGNEIKDDCIFCNVCGKRSENGVRKESTQEVIAIDEKEESSKEKRNSEKSKYIKLSAAILALVILIVGIVFSFPYISNAFNKLFMSSETYFKHVVKENLKEDVDEISSVMEELKETALLDEGTWKETIEIKTGESFETLMEIIDAKDTYEELSWIKEAKLDATLSINEKLCNLVLNLFVNEQDVISLDCVLDDKTVYVNLPGINEEYISVPMEESIFDSEEMELQKEIMALIPEEQVLSEIMNRYITIVVENVDSVSESKTTVEADSISQKCIKLTTHIDSATLKNASIDVCERLKEDKDILNIIKKACSLESEKADYDEIYKNYVSYLDEYIKEFENTSDSEEGIYLDLYVNSKGEIIGWCIYDHIGKLESVFSMKGKKFGYVCKFDMQGSQSISFEGGGKVNGKKLAGEFALKANTMSLVNVSLKDVDTKKSSEYGFTGTVEISLAESVKSLVGMFDVPKDIADMRIQLVSECASDDKGAVNLAIYMGEELCASLSASAQLSDSKKIDVPQKFFSSQNETEMMKWAQKIDFKAIIENLKKANVPLKYLDFLKAMYI